MEEFPKQKRELSEAGKLEWEMKEMTERHAKEADAQRGLYEWEMEERDARHGLDHLTELKTRKVFEHELEQSLKVIRGEIKEKRGEPLKEITLISIDLDHFKAINDTYGHLAGDEVLKKVSMLLANSVRETDVAARVGGEELMVLLRGANVQNAARHAEGLRAKIEKLAFDTYPGLAVTASFGVVSSLDSTDAKVLYEHADQTLYKAKRDGRNRVEVYSNP